MAPLPMSKARCRVLFVDDDPEIRKLYRRMARRHQFAADVAGSPVEALALARNRGYQVVVSDLQMPNLDGKTVLEHVGRELPNATLFVVTGVKPVPRISLRSKRAVTVVAKPWDDRDLATRIREALNTHERPDSVVGRGIADEASVQRLAAIKKSGRSSRPG